MQKSGIEILSEINEKLDLLIKHFQVIEQNTKELLRRANGPMVQTKVENIPTISGTVEAPKQPVPEMNFKTADSNQPVKVMGKIKKDNISVIGVNVKIINGKEVVKETRTNRAGDWMCFLPAGKYKAEYFLEGIINSYVDFQIVPGQKLLRVGQPGVINDNKSQSI